MTPLRTLKKPDGISIEKSNEGAKTKIDGSWRSCESAVAMNLSKVSQALKAYRSAKNADTVDDAEALRRAKVCKLCPMRRKVGGFIGRVSHALGAATGNHQLPEDLRDYKCGICQCSLLLLVPAIDANLHKDDREERRRRLKYAPSCWLLKIPLTSPSISTNSKP